MRWSIERDSLTVGFIQEMYYLEWHCDSATGESS
jgi:hypothetical protein